MSDQSNYEDEEYEMEENEEQELSSNDEEENDEDEKDLEDAEEILKQRKRLPKSAVDDQFFNLAEMEAFLNAQDKAEEKLQNGGALRRNLGDFNMAKEMEEIIQSYEEENLKPRSWAFQGEVLADQRKTDELLEHFVDVDYRTTAPPTITEETTQRLEAIIRKRCKEKLFDDVVRKVRENEASLVPTVYRNQTVIEQSVRKSLAEVYADKFLDAQAAGENHQEKVKAELDPQTAAIQKDMDSLFLTLDALSHFQFRPQPIQNVEPKVTNNMPSLRLEEVGPTTATEPDVSLLAPEEVMKRSKAAPKADAELTITDRKRKRRQKKKRQQSIFAAIGGREEKEGGGGSSSQQQQKKKKTRIQKVVRT